MGRSEDQDIRESGDQGKCKIANGKFQIADCK